MEDETPRSEALDTRGRVTRRSVLKALGGAGAAGALSFLLAKGFGFIGGDPPVKERSSGTLSGGRFDDFIDNITNGGPPKDGIPSIDEPRFVAAREATFLDDEDVVFGIVHTGEVRAYPQLVLVWHEIVNDRFPDGPLSVTYCPLTGSAVGFRGRAPEGAWYTFGTSGDLVNSNLLMYDRQTDNRWPQILGQALLDPLTGQALEEVSLDWTTWGRWRAIHPDTAVLSTDTGYARSYGDDPYGSYTPLSGYYEEGSPNFFPVMYEDPRFDAKEVVIGVKLDAARLAVRKDAVRHRGTISAVVGGSPVEVVYDDALDEAHAFIDRGGSREPVVSYDVMWFAWAAFFPQTDVVG